MAYVFCNQCGHRNPPESTFCSSCGGVLDNVAEHTLTLQRVDPLQDAPGTADDVVVPLGELSHETASLVVRNGPQAGSALALTALAEAGLAAAALGPGLAAVLAGTAIVAVLLLTGVFLFGRPNTSGAYFIVLVTKLAMFAAMHHVATINKLIDGGAQIGNRFINAFLLFRRIVRNKIGDHDTRLMQNRIA